MSEKICPICNTQTFPKWPKINFHYCSNCGLKIRINTSTDFLNDLYQNSWNDPENNKSETGGTNASLACYYLDQLKMELGNINYKGKTILDYGAGFGEILRVLKIYEANAIGIEPYGYQNLQAEGFLVYPTISENNLSSKVEGVICIDVIEHLSTPIDKMSEIYNCLKPGGWFFISTPNSKSLRANIQEDKWEEANRKGHIFLYTANSLQLVLKKAGFKKIKRIKWYVPYHKNPAKTLINVFLTFLKLDGELRYLAFKD